MAQEIQHFCIWCGSKLIEDCPECEKPILHANGKFCYNCGTSYKSRTFNVGRGIPGISEPAIAASYVDGLRFRGK